jgi:hypothetical protein
MIEHLQTYFNESVLEQPKLDMISSFVSVITEYGLLLLLS